jgi:ABC-type spermidine/putrescine transport system permease subunit II
MTLPRRIFESLKFESDPRVTAASAMLVGLSIAILLCFSMLRRWTQATASPSRKA